MLATGDVTVRNLSGQKQLSDCQNGGGAAAREQARGVLSGRADASLQAMGPEEWDNGDIGDVRV